MLEQRNPLETEEDNLLGEVELGFEEENEDLLLDDVENDMNSFVLNHKEAQDRLKSVVKISDNQRPSQSQFDQNGLNASAKDTKRKNTMAGDQSHLQELADQFTDMQN